MSNFDPKENIVWTSISNQFPVGSTRLRFELSLEPLTWGLRRKAAKKSERARKRTAARAYADGAVNGELRRRVHRRVLHNRCGSWRGRGRQRTGLFLRVYAPKRCLHFEGNCLNYSKSNAQTSKQKTCEYTRFAVQMRAL